MKECLEYCNSDVTILRQACLKFRKIFKDITGMDCFASALTIASACQQFFRYKFLPRNRVAIISDDGCNGETQSVIALQWMKYIAITEGIHIRHARNGGEVDIMGYKVDGFCIETNTVYEFH